jgi:hypothetical protein
MPGQDGKPIARLTTDDLSRIWPPNFAHDGLGFLCGLAMATAKSSVNFIALAACFSSRLG